MTDPQDALPAPASGEIAVTISLPWTIGVSIDHETSADGVAGGGARGVAGPAGGAAGVGAAGVLMGMGASLLMVGRAAKA